jgi:hypothetical protein
MYRLCLLRSGNSGEAKGVCKHRCPMTMRPCVEVKDRDNQADLAGTLIHEYAHALLHFDIDDRDEQAKREVEAEAVAYIVGRYFELEMSGSAFYLTAWNGDDAEAITDRLGRISHTAQELIDTLGQELEHIPKAKAKTAGAE